MRLTTIPFATLSIGFLLTCSTCGLASVAPIAPLLSAQSVTPSHQPLLPAMPSESAIAAIHVQYETYTSAAMGGQRTYGIVLPPGYDQNPEARYPVIFLLHGGHGNPTDWFDKGNALETLKQLYSSGKLPPSIVITPDGNDKRGSSPFWDPQYFDGPNGSVGTAIGSELVQIIQTHYRTLPNPTFWAIGGLSSGAWGALNIGLHYPNHFSILFSHSGYFVDRSGPQNSPMDVIKALSSNTLQHLKIYLDTGSSDEHFYVDQNQQFHQLLDQLHVTNQLQLFSGSHSWRYWRQHLADSLTFVGEQLSG